MDAEFHAPSVIKGKAKAIKAAQNQIKKGLGIPNAQANKEIREWLKK